MADSINDLELEREKLALERERLELERERLTDMKKLQSEEAQVAEKSKGHFQVALSTAVFLSVIALLTGCILGITATSWHLEQRDRTRREQLMANALNLGGTNRIERVEGDAAEHPQAWRNGEGHVWVILN